MNCLSSATLVVTTLATLCSGFLSAAEPELTAKDLPRLKPTEPADVLKTFTVRPGFKMDLVAHEPNVVSPVALAFDEYGRMFVVEMIDYSERRDEKLSRIRLLEDTNGDGHFEKSTIFAQDLPWATGVICSRGGIFVTASPDLIWFKDKDGDGKADERTVIFTGFAEGRDRLNMQALPNSLHWGLDNRIHGATGPNGGILRNLARPGDKPQDVNRRDFYFHPRTFELSTEAGGGQNGLSFDSAGRRYATSNSRHLMAYLFDGKYAARNPDYAMPNPLVDIPVDGPAAEVYRTSPDEAWRVIRTKWRVDGTVKGVVEGGGRPSGYFTGATGVTIYRGNAYPPEFRENAFIGDAGSNLVHRKRIRPDGAGLVAERAPDEQKSEFVASSDNWFRPVNFANGPDGCLYIIDMYREVIEHPWSIPESIKKFIDLNSGNDRGRIYRVVPDGFKQPKPVALGRSSSQELINLLEHPNGWHRDTASRLLFERQETNSFYPLEKFLKQHISPYGHLHGLYVMSGLSILRPHHLMVAMRSTSPLVRQHAVKLSETFLKTNISAEFKHELTRLTNDPAIEVRYQLAFTIGELPAAERHAPLIALAKKDGADRWARAAMFSSLPKSPSFLLNAIGQDDAFRQSAAGQAVLAELLPILAASKQAEDVGGAMTFLAGTPVAEANAYVQAIGSGLQRAGSSFLKSGHHETVKPVFLAARKEAVQATGDEARQVRSIQTLAFDPDEATIPVLLGILGNQNKGAVQLAAISALGSFSPAKVIPGIIKVWPELPLSVRGAAAELLLKRAENYPAVLDALEGGQIKPHELSAAQSKRLLEQRQASLKARAERIFAQSQMPKRDDVVKTFEPALRLKGDAAKGKLIYTERCASCHRAEGEGHALGPDIVTVKTTGREKLLVNILDPNREVPPQFLSYAIDTKDGESYAGLIVNESPAAVTLRMAFGQETTVTRANITKMNSNGQSLMPEGLESGLTAQDLANLLEFIVTANK